MMNSLRGAAFAFTLGIVGACSSSSTSSPDAGAIEVSCMQNVEANNRTPTCQCSTANSFSEANDTTCNAHIFSGTGACWIDKALDGYCECDEFVCGKSGATVYCGFDLSGNLTGDGPATLSDCTGKHNCIRVANGYCYCQVGACAAGDTEVSSCGSEQTLATLVSPTVQDPMVVADCRTALGGSSGGSSDAGSGQTDSGGGGPRCKSAGPGLCGDTPQLNRCNCGAGCFRDSAQAGSGFSCHITCKTDADCQNLYSFPTTCQQFVADTGETNLECRK